MPASRLTFLWKFFIRKPTTTKVLAQRKQALHYTRSSVVPTRAMTSSSKEPPAPASNIVELNGKQYEPIKEGLAYILKPVTNATENENPRGNGSEQPASVFYNPIQQFNRDLSVLAIKAFADSFVVASREKLAIAKKRQRNRRKAKKRKRAEDGDDDAELSGEFKKRHEGEQEVDVKGQNSSSFLQKLEENHVQEPDLKGQQDNADSKFDDEEENNHSANGNAMSGMKPVNFRILDALSATGLRALRYAKEIPMATRIVSNDLSPTAIEAIKLNIKYNEVDNIIQPNVGDARAYLYSLQGESSYNKLKNGDHIGKFDVIDLDPYGTAVPFLDAAIQGLSDGGLLCVTCTDAGVFASTGYLEKAFSSYGGVSVRLPHGHEVGLRLILNAITTSAAKYGIAVEPLLSLSIDYYARVFVRIHKSPAEVKFLSGTTMLVYSCDAGCGAWTTQYLSHTKLREVNGGKMVYRHSLAQAPTASQTCEHCGFKTHLAGPMWGGPLHNSHFIRRILDMLPDLDPETYQTLDRIEGMLTTALEEDLDLPDPSSEDQPQSPAAEAAEASLKQDKPKLDEKTIPKTDSSLVIPRIPPNLQEKYPFFVSLSNLSRIVHTETIPMNAFRGALHKLKYRTTRSHTKPNSVRTDAPWDVIWEIMREWVRQHPSPATSKGGAGGSTSNIKPGTPGAGIMKKDRSKYDENNALSVLQREISQALEEGKDVSDLTTRIEAALYRRGKRYASNTGETQPNSTKEGGGGGDVGQKNGEKRPHPSTLQIVFDENLGREFSNSWNRTKKPLVRYPENPEANWGPMSKAAGR